MKVHQIISESNNRLDEGPAGAIIKKLLPKRKPQGLAPSSSKARKYRDELKANKAKSAEALKKADAAARAKLEKAPIGVMTVIKAGVGIEFARQYYVDLSLLEQEYAETLAAIRRGESNMSEQEAYDAYQTQRRKLLGELTVGLALNMGVASKAFGALSSMFKGVTSTAARYGGVGRDAADIIGKTAALTPRLLQGVSKLIEMGPAAPAFLIFMRSEYGKAFLNDTHVRLITEFAGGLTSAAIDGLEKGLQAAGILDAEQKLPGKTAAVAPTGDAADGPRQDTNSGMPIQWVGKKLYVDAQQISDENGYRIVGNNHIADIKRSAAALNIPDPTLKLRDDPNRKYSVYGAEPIK
jgi:hypothetical protein